MLENTVIVVVVGSHPTRSHSRSSSRCPTARSSGLIIHGAHPSAHPATRLNTHFDVPPSKIGGPRFWMGLGWNLSGGNR